VPKLWQVESKQPAWVGALKTTSNIAANDLHTGTLTKQSRKTIPSSSKAQHRKQGDLPSLLRNYHRAKPTCVQRGVKCLNL